MTTSVRSVRPSARLSIASLIDDRGSVRVDGVAVMLHLSKAQLAETAGLAREVLQKSSRRDGPKAQGRLREMVEILARVQGWAGGPAQAMAWYRAEPIPAFGGRTAEALVKSGQAAALRDYLDHLATGGYA
ncbi:MAG: antitoxin Xre/MbcA/ParS toxin-binding domain-containing protein [Acetobacteraceae bacterium]